MKKTVLLCTIVTFIACNDCKVKDVKNEANSKIEEGKRLVTALGCNDCHSPKKMSKFGPVPDENLLLSGHPQHLALAEYDPSVPKSGQWILFNGSGTAAVGP